MNNEIQSECEYIFAMYKRKEINYNNMLWKMSKLVGNNVTVEQQKDIVRIITPDKDFFIRKCI